MEVVDSGSGRPAAGVAVTITYRTGSTCVELPAEDTDGAGRVAASLPTGLTRYRLRLNLDRYFAGFGVTPRQSQIALAFRGFHPTEHLHLLVLVTSSSCSCHVIRTGESRDGSR